MDLALNNQQWLMCHKTKPNQHKELRNNTYYPITRFFLHGVINEPNFRVATPSRSSKRGGMKYIV